MWTAAQQPLMPSVPTLCIRCAGARQRIQPADQHSWRPLLTVAVNNDGSLLAAAGELHIRHDGFSAASPA